MCCKDSKSYKKANFLPQELLLDIKLKEFRLKYTQRYASFGNGSSEKNAGTASTNACAYDISTYEQDSRQKIYNLFVFLCVRFYIL